jgi:hypothetical protein
MIRQVGARPTVIAFTGTRTHCNAEDRGEIVFTLHRILAEHRLLYPPGVRVGDCKTGVDAFVRRLFGEGSIYSNTELTVVEVDPAIKWPAAGPERNSRIIDKSPNLPDLLLSFPRRGRANKGTIDCTTKAIRAGVDILVTYLGARSDATNES